MKNSEYLNNGGSFYRRGRDWAYHRQKLAPVWPEDKGLTHGHARAQGTLLQRLREDRFEFLQTQYKWETMFSRNDAEIMSQLYLIFCLIIKAILILPTEK